MQEDQADPYVNPEWIVGESLELDFSPELGEITEAGDTYSGFSYDTVGSPYENE